MNEHGSCSIGVFSFCPYKSTGENFMKLLSKRMLALAMTCTLSACASIVGGRYQPVTVDARSGGQDIVGAQCTLTNDRGQFIVTTPGTVTVHRGSAPLSVNCVKSGVIIGQQSVASHIRPMLWGNIVFGGVVGLVVDFSDGAAHYYPKMVTVVSQVSAAAEQMQGSGASSPVGGHYDDLASLDPRIGPPMFMAAQNAAAREQCDSAIRVLMVDGQRALFESRCAAGSAIQISCRENQCTSLHEGSAMAVHQHS